jgi:hypothetical protein
MKFSLLLSLISLNAFAMDCAGMPEGRVVRLDDPSGPLANSSIQDQDGIGSCYANQASVMLQSIIPGNPDLSYLNLGLYYATDYTVPKFRKSSGTYTNIANGTGPIDGGFSCKAINAALARQKSSGDGVLCKSSDVPMDHNFVNNMVSSSPDNAAKVMSVTAGYMTMYQNEFGWAEQKDITDAKLQAKRAKADQFKKALKKFVQDSGDAYLTKKCEIYNPNNILDLMENALTRAINSSPQCISGKSISTSSPICQSFSQLGMITTISGSGKSSKVKFIQTSQSREQLKKSVLSMFKNKNGVNSFLNELSGYVKNADRSNNSLGNKDAFAKLIVKSISDADMRVLTEDYNRIALKNFDRCKEGNALDFIVDKDFQKNASKDVVLCNYKSLVSNIQLVALNMPKYAFNDLNAFVDFVTEKAGLSYDQAMLPLIASDCRPEERVRIPDNLKCDQVVMNFKAGAFRPGSTNPAGQEAVEVIKANRKKMMASIDNKAAFGLTFCSKYWKDPSYGYNNLARGDARNRSCQSGRDSIHSITAIGYRCKNNKVQYLAQNSWGPNWRSEPNKSLEIKDGKVWLDEDALFQNLETIDYMSL